jgi:prepilin-type N-terminal cleavage/methylation domain-containing protein
MKHRSGFTLVEFTVVITIIAILAAILFPVFAQARKSATKQQCQSNLHQVGMALQLYARDHDGNLPPAHNDLRPLLTRYADSESILRCPEDPVAPAKPLRVNRGYVSYQYRAGLSMEDRADIPLVADWEFWHQDGANVLVLSGSVKFTRGQSNWRPVARGPRPLPITVAWPASLVPMTFLNSPPAAAPAPAPGFGGEE